eukprot:1385009-Rhodomonas_salina.1
MYNNVIAIQGKLHNIGLYLRAYYEQPATRWNVMRGAITIGSETSEVMVWLGFGDCWQPQNSQYKKDPGTFQDLINKTLVAKGVLIKVEADCISVRSPAP